MIKDNLSLISKMKTLIIVESPSKCKKIEEYLGTNYKVIASCGHFIKLESLDQIQFDTYQIQYKIDKTKVLKSIREEIKKCKEVILATDDDREGEAIAWSLCTFCKLNLANTKKMVFQEITKSALEHALSHVTHINMDRVRSQQARQIVDIYLGYKVSPLLWKYVQHKLSAGRCQTPALRLIYENEKEFETLSNNTHYIVKALFTSKNISFQGSSPIKKENIEDMMHALHDKANWKIDHKKERQGKESPPRILITSTLQQRAHQLFRYSPKATMKYAQELYENGLITYMRTDSACYSQEFIEKVKKHIIQHYGAEYVNENLSLLHENKNKNKSQEAHEGIRVCDLSKDEANVKTKCANTLYAFIYKHSIQCAMSTATYVETTFETMFNSSFRFRYNEKSYLFQGWKKIERDKPKPSFVSYLNMCLDSKTEIVMNYAEANESLMETKCHYHEASLIQKLESLNIGRPSTYASILQSLLDKKYVNKENIMGEEMEIHQFVSTIEDGVIKKTEKKRLHQEKNKLHITPMGKQVSEFCNTYFPKVFDYSYTNTMESYLDEIEYGNMSQKEVLTSFISNLDHSIQETNEFHHENPDKIQKTKDTSLYCGKYQNEALYIKSGKYGYYLCLGKKTKISLNEFEGFSIEKKIASQTNEINESEAQCLYAYIEGRKEKRNENICVELSSICSIRKSKYGYYIFYQTKQMKKPQFLKYNDEKDQYNEERMQWIETKNKAKIMSYVSKKYSINI